MHRANIHASCVRLGKAGRIFGAPSNTGVLILGESGAGKSDLTLRLIERGAVLVSDDRTDLSVTRGKLFASAPNTIAGLIEVRGLGIVELPHARKVQLALAVVLRRNIQRMPELASYTPPKALKLPACAPLPLVAINPFEASAPAKIAIAAAAFAARLFREKVKPD